MLKKNRECHSATERIYGTVIKRWYIKSPSNNYYFIYRSNYAICMSTGPGTYDYTYLHTKTGDVIHTFKDAMKVIYDLDTNGCYKHKVSIYVKNLPECINMFSTKENIAYTTY